MAYYGMVVGSPYSVLIICVQASFFARFAYVVWPSTGKGACGPSVTCKN